MDDDFPGDELDDEMTASLRRFFDNAEGKIPYEFDSDYPIEEEDGE